MITREEGIQESNFLLERLMRRYLELRLLVILSGVKNILQQARKDAINDDICKKNKKEAWSTKFKSEKQRMMEKKWLLLEKYIILDYVMRFFPRRIRNIARYNDHSPILQFPKINNFFLEGRPPPKLPRERNRNSQSHEERDLYSSDCLFAVRATDSARGNHVSSKGAYREER